MCAARPAKGWIRLSLAVGDEAPELGLERLASAFSAG
jgi:hypothetical protein